MKRNAKHTFYFNQFLKKNSKPSVKCAFEINIKTHFYDFTVNKLKILDFENILYRNQKLTTFYTLKNQNPLYYIKYFSRFFKIEKT